MEKNKCLIVCSQISEERDKLRKKYGITDENEVYAPCVYMHGELQDLVGYDQVEVLNPEELTLRTVVRADTDGESHTLRCIDFTGIIDCIVIGVDEPCTAFLWNTDEPRYMSGLICLKSDTASIHYAVRKFDERAFII